MKKKILTCLSVSSILLLSACSSTTKPTPQFPNFTTTEASKYVEPIIHKEYISIVNQLKNVQVIPSESVSKNLDTLASRGFTPQELQSYVSDNLLNTGMYSPKSGTGLTLTIYLDSVRIRPEFIANSIGGLSGHDYIDATITVTNSANIEVAKANITTPTYTNCPQVINGNEISNSCDNALRVSTLSSYLMNETYDFIKGGIVKPN